MAISLVGTATGTTTATPPAHVAGDLFLVFSFRDGSATAPTLASGFTTSSNGGGNTCSHRVGWKIAASSSETVGTWTNATSLILIVIRGADQTTPIGANNLSTGASTTITYPTITMQVTDGTSWVFAFGGHRSANVAIDTVPSGMTLTSSVSDATDEAAAFRLEGATSFTSRTAAVGGTSSGWRSASIEVRAAADAPPPTEYTQSADITSSALVGSALAAGLIMQGIASSGTVSKALSAGKRASISGLSSISRALGAIRAIGIASSGAMTSVKAMSRRVAISAGSSVSAVVSRAYILALAISSAASVSARRAIGKRSAITSAALVTARKAMGKGLGLASAASASIRKKAGKVASVTSSSSLATQRAIGARMAVPAVSVVSVGKSMSVALSVASSASASASKAVAASFFIASSALASIGTAIVQATGYIKGKVSRGIVLFDHRTFAGSVEGDGLAEGTASPKRNAGMGAAVARVVSGIIKRKR